MPFNFCLNSYRQFQVSSVETFISENVFRRSAIIQLRIDNQKLINNKATGAPSWLGVRQS